MTRAWKIFRFVAVTLLLIAVGLPVGLYVALSTPWAQRQLCRIAAEELSGLLSTEVSIDRVALHPFNRISVYGLSAADDYGRRALSVSEVSAGFELRHFLLHRRMVVDYALVDGADICLYKQSPDSPLNVARILDKLRGDGRQKPPTRFDLKINTVILRNARLSYDVRTAPRRQGFDPRHIRLYGLNLNAHIPRLSNEQYTVEINRLDFREGSGFELSGLTTRADVRSNGIDLSDLIVRLPRSMIKLEPLHLNFDRFEQLPQVLAHDLTAVEIASGSNLYLPDLKAFSPVLNDLPLHFDISMSAEASLSEIRLHNLDIADRHGASRLELIASVRNLRDSVSPDFDIDKLEIVCKGPELASLLPKLASETAKAASVLNRLPGLSLTASGSGSLHKADLEAAVSTGSDAVDIRAGYHSDRNFSNIAFNADVDIDNVDLGNLLRDNRLGKLSAGVSANGRLTHGKFTGHAELLCDRLGFNGHDFNAIEAQLDMNRSDALVRLNVDDSALRLNLGADCTDADKDKELHIAFELNSLDLDALNLSQRFPGYKLSASLSADVSGSNADNAQGQINIDGLSLTGAEKSVTLNHLQLNLDRDNGYAQADICSDFLNGQASGQIAFSTLVAQLRDMAADVFPVFASHLPCGEPVNNFTYDLTLSDTRKFTDFFGLPVNILSPVSISGSVNSPLRYADLTVDAPFLQQGDKIIEGTAIVARLDGADSHSLIYGTSRIPTKKGPLGLVFTLNGSDNRIDSHFDWMIERKIPINGKIGFSTLLERDANRQLSVDVDFNRSDITFGNEVWEINPAHLNYSSGALTVDNLRINAPSQSIAIDGTAGKEYADSLQVSLDNVEMLEIFETLEIDKALIGGHASGTVTGHALLSKTPVIQTECLHVENISYNRCVLGDAEVKARFNNEKQSFYLDADITEPDGRHSHIYGDIFPATESLDISFDADRVRVGFMQPFMSAFASSVDGYASGHARLFGTFKYIDMEGDIFADSLRVKIDFTNTWYTASDSIRLRPGIIDIKNAVVRDPEGHTATLNGTVRHTFFKQPIFDFAVTDARDFLSYDTDPRISPDWYGRIYGNGSAFISGHPGVVNINVSMTTAPRSRFTFVLSDQLIADEYSFITFRDKTAPDSDRRPNSDIPPEVMLARSKADAQNSDEPSAYNMDISVDITPDADITIVMDPVGGDRIKATGEGNMRLTYGSLNNDLHLYGEYTLESGSYNFTLQDIIIKDFSISRGSSIAFHGDPYNATLDIKAVYQVNANLSDLDESFLQDKDLNRTNVPVQAQLMVTGPMRQPDIKFDLLFPTLNEDIYRKVHSIVSTEDMMNRQIIYLLALNRFYTPDYVASTTKGSEMFAVASSTISSQLSSMLGKLSDNWSIAPNLRSDRGDFSDVEVDVALSSRLLNNRLLFNGNFGYRDKSLNTNQFIGDFDIEYLLNRKGSWRLKAYNRYNDQNYYVRTAATTQGVGVMFRKDFDDFFKFLRKKKKPAQADSLDTGSRPQADSTVKTH